MYVHVHVYTCKCVIKMFLKFSFQQMSQLSCLYGKNGSACTCESTLYGMAESLNRETFAIPNIIYMYYIPYVGQRVGTWIFFLVLL